MIGTSSEPIKPPTTPNTQTDPFVGEDFTHMQPLPTKGTQPETGLFPPPPTRSVQGALGIFHLESAQQHEGHHIIPFLRNLATTQAAVPGNRLSKVRCIPVLAAAQ